MRTTNLPARLKKVVNAAPLLPLSSLTTCMTISCPSFKRFLIFCFSPGTGCVRKYSFDISRTGRNPFLPEPKSTNTESKLGSTRVIVPLYILFFFCIFDATSISKS